MPTEVKLPRLGQGMDEGKILRWLKAEGDPVKKGEEIYEVETEKVNVEVESPANGVLLKIVIGEGTEVPIGTVLAYVGAAGEAIPDSPTPSANGSAAAPASAPTPKADPTPAPVKPAPTAAVVATAAPTSSSSTDRIKASPLARRIAKEQGVDLGALHGTGPEGRIVARDLEGAPVALPASAQVSIPVGEDVESVPLTSMRKTIARRLGEAWQAPAFYLTIDVDMEQANALRKRLVDAMKEGETKPTVSDILTKAAATALRRNRDMNVHFAGDSILKFASVHVGLAVATEAGLVVPVIRNAHAKSVREIAADRAAIVAKARDGKLAPADFEGGTFTISNLGMMGIQEFTAVLNPPMAGIMAVGATVDTPVAVGRKVEIRPRMKVTLGCDHRAVDGAVGARFLASFKEHMEDPLTMV